MTELSWYKEVHSRAEQRREQSDRRIQENQKHNVLRLRLQLMNGQAIEVNTTDKKHWIKIQEVKIDLIECKGRRDIDRQSNTAIEWAEAIVIIISGQLVREGGDVRLMTDQRGYENAVGSWIELNCWLETWAESLPRRVQSSSRTSCDDMHRRSPQQIRSPLRHYKVQLKPAGYALAVVQMDILVKVEKYASINQFQFR